MTTPEGIAFGSLVIGLLTFLYKTTTDEAGKRARIYARMDGIKKVTEEKFQTKEICAIHTETIMKDLQEIKADVKILLKNNGH